MATFEHPINILILQRLPVGPGGDYWGPTQDNPCPDAGCGGRIVWAEAGHVPGTRQCNRCGALWQVVDARPLQCLVRLAPDREGILRPLVQPRPLPGYPYRPICRRCGAALNITGQTASGGPTYRCGECGEPGRHPLLAPDAEAHTTEPEDDGPSPASADAASPQSEATATRWHVTAEHTKGRSVSHPCRDGIYDDPANELDLMVDAESEPEAAEAGRRWLDDRCQQVQPCRCERHLSPGGESWWDSVAIVAVPVEGPSSEAREPAQADARIAAIAAARALVDALVEWPQHLPDAEHGRRFITAGAEVMTALAHLSHALLTARREGEGEGEGDAPIIDLAGRIVAHLADMSQQVEHAIHGREPAATAQALDRVGLSIGELADRLARHLEGGDNISGPGDGPRPEPGDFTPRPQGRGG